MDRRKTKIGIIGLGYVGLPLAQEFGKHFNVIGYDIDNDKVLDLKKKYEITANGTTLEEFDEHKILSFTYKITDLKDCNVFIITVPTPTDENNIPDLSYLKKACYQVGSILSKEDIVIFESTVFPGCTEEICVPILEGVSKLKYIDEFNCGYSPERINTGVTSHNLVNIIKITSGSTKRCADFVDNLYKTIIDAGTYMVSSIKIAEAAKITENIQRYVNISLINELSIIYSKMGINIYEVLAAAETKWNFHSYSPGLIGGHCISVDPFYLSYRAKELGLPTQLINSSYIVNEKIISFIEQSITSIIEKTGVCTQVRCLFLGCAFKPNVSDYRNSQVFRIYKILESKNYQIDIYDPLVNKNKVFEEFGVELIEVCDTSQYHVVFKLVNHDIFNGLKHLNLIALEDIFMQTYL